ncbi:MAG: protein phosphatase 2C domain-containing protein [Clostridia bacterium]|nr:protein phosphatase 2C domain-containing protein [Clostridia bacterium]
MDYIFNKSKIGYSHIQSKKVCQDFSASYRDLEREIITCCDGHGGDSYFRSNLGSKFASEAVVNVFKSLEKKDITSLKEEDLVNKIKLDILCEWNRLVESHYSKNHFKKSELDLLDEHKRELVKDNYANAYGTTLTGAMVYRGKLLIIGIGDTECLLIRKGKLSNAFENEDDPVANITYSMCQEDAFEYLRVNIVDYKDYDGIILCTDGLSGPYQSYTNFNSSFIKPLFCDLSKTQSTVNVSNLIDDIASKLGTGDDVSVSFIIKEKFPKLYYK